MSSPTPRLIRTKEPRSRLKDWLSDEEFDWQGRTPVFHHFGGVVEFSTSNRESAPHAVGRSRADLGQFDRAAHTMCRGTYWLPRVTANWDRYAERVGSSRKPAHS